MHLFLLEFLRFFFARDFLQGQGGSQEERGGQSYVCQLSFAVSCSYRCTVVPLRRCALFAFSLVILTDFLPFWNWNSLSFPFLSLPLYRQVLYATRACIIPPRTDSARNHQMQNIFNE